VYRLSVDDGTTVIAYLWQESENYWPQAPNENDVADPFSPGNSIDLFATAHATGSGCVRSLQAGTYQPEPAGPIRSGPP
jgi:hypothetical protein